MRPLLFSIAALVCFAANSILCRLALAGTSIDPTSFTTIRVASGAAMLGLLLMLERGGGRRALLAGGDWASAAALYAYAILFSFAYISLSAGTGALLLFGAVQLTMLGAAYRQGERFDLLQAIGLALAVGGVVGLLAPGASAPPPISAALMLGAGVAWGLYSLRGRRSEEPLADTAGNFLRALPLALVLSLGLVSSARIDAEGVIYAVLSGALASGLGYALWYAALRGLSAARAATLQLAVPVLAALGGVVFIGEALTPRLVVASAAVLGGIALVVRARRR